MLDNIKSKASRLIERKITGGQKLLHLFEYDLFLFSVFLMQLLLLRWLPAKLRIILEDDEIRKLVLPLGIPSPLQDLHDVIQETFHIPRAFNVMYEDMDFGGQFCTLSSIEEVQDKDTLKLVFTQPIVLTLSPVEVSDVESLVPEQSSDTSSGHSSGSQDTILLLG